MPVGKYIKDGFTKLGDKVGVQRMTEKVTERAHGPVVTEKLNLKKYEDKQYTDF